MSVELIVAGIVVPLLLWFYTPQQLRDWLRRKLLRTALQAGQSEPYRMKSSRPEEDSLTAVLVNTMGGLDGPCKPRMVIRYMVPEYEGNGFVVIRSEDGRECVWTGKVSDGTIQECVLMAKSIGNHAGVLRQNAESFLRNYTLFLRQLKAAWESERDTRPIDVGRAKILLETAWGELISFASHDFLAADATREGQIKAALRMARRLIDYRIQIDGGFSYNSFWNEGNAFLRELEGIRNGLEVDIQGGNIGR